MKGGGLLTKPIEQYRSIVTYGLSSKHRQSKVMKFLKKTFNDENFDFIVHVEKFKKTPTVPKFKTIYKTFNDKSSPRQVNLPSVIQHELDMIYSLTNTTSKMHSNVFDKAVKNITHMLNQNSWTKFKEQEQKKRA